MIVFMRRGKRGYRYIGRGWFCDDRGRDLGWVYKLWIVSNIRNGRNRKDFF